MYLKLALLYLLCLCFFYTTNLLAQPTLTQNNHFPATQALRYTHYKCDTVNVLPGASGEAVLWDFSQLNLSSVLIDAGTYVLPSQTNYSNFFPSAQTCELFSNNQLFYYTDNADSTALLGYITVSGTSINQVTYTDPLTIMRYPFQYGNTFSDDAARVYGNITGTVNTSSQADAYGTLILPLGIFDNVLRVHTQTSYNDIATNGQFFNLTDDLYEWYNGTYPKALLTIRVRTIDNNGVISNTKFVDFADIIAASSLQDDYGYSYSSNLSNPPANNCNFIDISQTGTLITGLDDDNLVGTFDMGFPFQYYWSSYNKLSIGSNGYIVLGEENFNLSSLAGNFTRIPTADNNNNFVAPLLCDLNFSGISNPAKAYIYSNNIDTCIIMFKNVPFWTNETPEGYEGSNTFEVIFAASDSSVTFAYQDLSPRTDMNQNYQVSVAPLITGIENSNGTIGLQMALSAIPPDHSCYKFVPPTSPLVDVTDVYPQWNQNEQNAAIFLLQNDVVNLKSRIKNGGNLDINEPIQVVSKILDYEGNNFGDSIVHSIDALPQSESQELITWEDFPAIEGNYTCIVSATTAMDMNPSNDANISEIVVVDTSAAGEMNLCYANETSTNLSTLSWSNGSNYTDGCAIYVAPPFYPARIEAIEFFVVPLNNNPVITTGFRAQIKADNAPNPADSELLFEVDVPLSQIEDGTWNTIQTDNDTIVEGGFYVAWLMENTGIALSTDLQMPFSRRNYEILSGAWSPYRSNANEDLFIRVKMKAIAPIDTSTNDTSVAVHQINQNLQKVRLDKAMPNPSNGNVSISYYLPKHNKQVSLHIYDVLGKKRKEYPLLPNLSGDHSLQLQLNDLLPGIYTYTLLTDDSYMSKQLIIK